MTYKTNITVVTQNIQMQCNHHENFWMLSLVVCKETIRLEKVNFISRMVLNESPLAD